MATQPPEMLSKKLGMRKESPHGKLVLVYGTSKHEGGEIFTLREKDEEGCRSVNVTSLNPPDKSEKLVSGCTYFENNGVIRLDGIETHGHLRRREIAGSIIAYIRKKEMGKDMRVTSSYDAREFYERLGFEPVPTRSRLYNLLLRIKPLRRVLDYSVMVLPKEARLKRGPFEKTRRFAIFPKKTSPKSVL